MTAQQVAAGDPEFTTKWFSAAKPVWDNLMPREKPTRLLEIGSFEGASACYLIETLGSKYPIELHCVDTWQGGIEHQSGGLYEKPMTVVEERFRRNTDLARAKAPHPIDLQIHKATSDMALAGLLASGKASYFDFIYVDGSHQAPDVMIDAVLAFKLLRVDGILAFDDYLWSEKLATGVDPIRCPKIAIDAFTNIFCRKIKVLPGGGIQLYTRKTAE
jgi:predicted O-methyltransferase YrrM